MNRPIVITGGAGFIGSALVREALASMASVVVIDNLSYAGNLASLSECFDDPGFHFERIDICNREALSRVFRKYQPGGLIHLAAETHVDRSIDEPDSFINTNINGTYQLLETSRTYLAESDRETKSTFRFHHVSTDEVYGDIKSSTGFFTEETPYAPSSPYSASKAASDHLVRAWGRTFQLPVLTTNCSNNYGPRQFPEKLIPQIILNALAGKPLPVYGDGNQVRDWLYVTDHAKALLTVYSRGEPGETYNIGGHNTKRNIEVVHAICDLLEEIAEKERPAKVAHFSDLITFVKDRPGHDVRYAIDASKIERELGWSPDETFESGLRKTVQWYWDSKEWWKPILSNSYKLERLGQR